VEAFSQASLYNLAVLPGSILLAAQFLYFDIEIPLLLNGLLQIQSWTDPL
jgi:hypothetical protein